MSDHLTGYYVTMHVPVTVFIEEYDETSAKNEAASSVIAAIESYDIGQCGYGAVEFLKVQTECEAHGHRWVGGNLLVDMQGHCEVCGAPEE